MKWDLLQGNEILAVKVTETGKLLGKIDIGKYAKDIMALPAVLDKNNSIDWNALKVLDIK
jgi:hypothetical protein